MQRLSRILPFLILTLTCFKLHGLPHEPECTFASYTVPKAGSHLLDAALKHMTGQQGMFFNQHPIHNKKDLIEHLKIAKLWGRYEISHHNHSHLIDKWREELGCKVFFIYRDPRDVVISWVNYNENGNSAIVPKQWKSWSLDEKISYTIESMHGVGIRKFFTTRLGWMDSQNCYTVRFENLVGEKGGGREDLQLQELQNISTHLGLRISDKELLEVANKLYGDSHTFFKGYIGRWKEHFKPHHIQRCKELIGDLLISLNYESDLNW